MVLGVAMLVCLALPSYTSLSRGWAFAGVVLCCVGMLVNDIVFRGRRLVAEVERQRRALDDPSTSPPWDRPPTNGGA
jgi:hypothetical protein